jgi:transcriptional regulator with XRE-family HTH domain
MDVAALLREARRRAGLSQRAMAAAAGVPRSSLEAAESGRRQPSLALLEAVAGAAELELALDHPVQPLDSSTRRHLHRSLSQRLHLLVGGDGRPWYPPRLAAWRSLDDLTATGRLSLVAASAVGLWLPAVVAGPVRLVLEPHAGTLQRTSPQVPPALEVSIGPRPSDATIAVPLPVRALWTPPPAALALDPACAPWRQALRSVAAALDAEAAVDVNERRAPAHREVQAEQEAWRLLFARRWTSQLLPPDRLDGRAWRLDGEVGMRTWIDRRAARG